MKIQVDISNKEDIQWLNAIPLDKKDEVIRNCITIGRLALDNCRMNLDNSKFLEPIIEQFKLITKMEVDKAIDGVHNTIENIVETRDKLDSMTRVFQNEIRQNSQTMLECVRSQSSLTEKLLEPIHSRIDKMNEGVEKIFSVKSSSNVKGKVGESIISQHIQTAFPSYDVMNMSQNPHEADYHIVTDFGKVLLEIKTYQNTVGKDQIEKFYKDIERTGIQLAIFLSTTSGIVGKKTIEWEVYSPTRTIILYFPNSSVNLESVVFSFLFLKALQDLGVHKNESSDLMRSNEEILELFKMFDEFYKNLLDVLEKQTKLRFQISTIKTSINKSIDELYKQSFDLELESKIVIDGIYGKLKSHMVSYDKSLEHYKRLEDYSEYHRFIHSLGIKSVQTLALEQLYSICEDFTGLQFYYEKDTKSPKLTIIYNSKIITNVSISKTKIELVFELPKNIPCIYLNPKYETYKNNQVITILENDVDCMNLVTSRIKAKIETI